MTISAHTKRLSAVALVLGLAVGCAAQPEKEEEKAEKDVCEGMSASVQSAIDKAKSFNADARAMGADWREARKLINQAEAAGAECEDDRAMRLAREARLAAQDAMARHMAAEAREEEAMKTRSYTVMRGDTLWGISGSSVGYNDPYQWPLIYRANQDKIRDADLIYPGQEFKIQTNPNADQVDLAIWHAKNRGDWEVGVTEGSDWKYLKQAEDMGGM